MRCRNHAGCYQTSPFSTGDQDGYKLSSSDYRLLSFLRRSRVGCAVLQLAAMAGAAGIAYFMHRIGVRSVPDYFAVLYNQQLPNYPFLILSASALFGFGLAPASLCLRIHDAILRYCALAATVRTTYGSSPESARLVARHVTEHLHAINQSNVATTSAISLGHLLSRVGLAKYAKQSSTEYFAAADMDANFLADSVTPVLANDHGDSALRADHSSNALAAILALVTRSSLPPQLRRKAQYFNVAETNTLCPSLATAAGAKVHLSSTVIAIGTDKSKYSLTVGRGESGASVHSGIDAVILCAGVDATDQSFSIADLDRPLSVMLGLSSEKPSRHMARRKENLNSMQNMALVSGELNPAFLRRSKASRICSRVTVLDSVAISEVLRVVPGVYRVVCSEETTESSTVIKNLFETTDRIVSWKRPRRRGENGRPVRDLDGADSPSLILDTRLLNACCVDRVTNHPELYIVPARNAASLLRDGIVSWTEPSTTKTKNPSNM
jgi:hypothetical protein